jgi:hypothetical protein
MTYIENDLYKDLDEEANEKKMEAIRRYWNETNKSEA